MLIKNDLESSHVSDSSNSPLNSSEENHCENQNDFEVNNIVEHLDNSSASSNDSSDNQIESVSLIDELKDWNNEYNVSFHKIIPNQFKNSFVLLHDKSIVSVKNISENAVKVHKYRAMKPLFKYPTSSSLLDMQLISIPSRSTPMISEIKKSDIWRKCMILPYKKNYAIIPFL